MGTSIIAALLAIHWQAAVGLVFAVIGTGILAVTLYGLARYRSPRFLPEYMGPWGMFAMGVISLGSAWTAISGDSIYQLIGYLTGGLGGFIIALNQWRKFVGSPNFQWGLALVVPMVAATNAAQLGFIGFYWAGPIWFHPRVDYRRARLCLRVLRAHAQTHNHPGALGTHRVDSGGGCWAIHSGCTTAFPARIWASLCQRHAAVGCCG